MTALAERRLWLLYREVSPELCQAVANHVYKWGGCKLCPLGCQPEVAQKVFFRGSIPADVVFVGEAPGASENATGYPFVNPSAAGGVFDSILEGVLSYNTELTWAVTNAVLCFPVNPDPNKDSDFRTPTTEEIKACSPRLMEFLELCNPKLIVVMGKVAERATATLGEIKWKASEDGRQTIPIMPNIRAKIISIAHPSWMQRKGQDTELEIKRAVLNIVGTLKRM